MSMDFDTLWQRQQEARAELRCPLSEDELRQRVKKAQQEDVPTGAKRKGRVRLIKWYQVAAAACVAAVLVTTSVLSLHRESDLGVAKVDGQQVYFACNTGCSAEGMINLLNDYIESR